MITLTWCDELTLVAVTPPAERVNEHGFPNDPSEVQTVVFANRKSVGCSEFYKAAQAGYATDLKFDVYTEEYEGQKYAEYAGKRYKVLRTYTPEGGDTTELTLSDLTERGGADG